jgi:uncharacterized protein (TIGR02453 family)
MALISKNTLQFLRDLKENNNRDWFLSQKSRYESAKSEFELFVEDVLAGISKFDKDIGHFSARDCIFRIYRDVRFSSDKSPYKTHFGAHVTAAAKKSEIHSRAGYYIHIGPGVSMLAGGAYMPQGPWLKAIRNEIADDPESFKRILDSKDFRKYFGKLEGEQLKTAPRDFPKDHPEIELLRYKSFLATHRCTDAVVTSADFPKHCMETFKALYPFDQFLNRVAE